MNNVIRVANIPEQKIEIQNDGPVYVDVNIVKKTITANGIYDPKDENADGYNPVVVNVKPKIAGIGLYENGIYRSSDRGLDGYSVVHVAVPPYGEGTVDITENGTHDVSGKATANVEVDTTQAYENGRKAERDAFWDGFQQNGQRNNYSYAFTSTYWTDDVYHPIHPIVMSGGNTNAYYNNTVTTNTKVPIDIRGTVLNNTFRYATALETIPELIVDETTQIGAGFSYAAALKNITISGTIGQDLDIHWSPLSADSVQSIIDALKDLNGDTAKTLTLHQNAGAALTAEQKAAITAKNWTLVY